ncbi:MAG TPA: LysR substrate-binding domain-containing protein, partial [Rhizobium sp.]|nr:LysR substrate-binding domain-containing protein [Rhizobium sp.]
FHEGCAYRRHLLESLEAKGIRSQVVYEGQSYANVLAAVRAGFGITALAESQVEAGGLMRLQRLGDADLAELGTVEIVLRQAVGRSNAALKAFARAIELHMPEGPAATVSSFPASASPFLVPAGVGRPAPGGQSLAR